MSRGLAYAYGDPDTGRLVILCPRGHVIAVDPIRWNPENREAVYGSQADYCEGCEADTFYTGSSAFEFGDDYDGP